MDTPEFSSYSRPGVFEGLCKGTDPREMTAEGGRQILDTAWQPSACGDISRLQALYLDVTERLAKVEKEISKKRIWSDSVDTRLQFLESCHRQHAASDHYKMQETSNPDPPYKEGHRSYQEVVPERVIQKELQEKEEYKKLEEKLKELEARCEELLLKMMGTHQDSENMNDPSRLSTTLQMYKTLRLYEWEKLRSFTASYLSYKTGSGIIKKLFDACERDIEQRITNVFKVLDIPPLNDTMTNSKEAMMQEIRNLVRYSYYQNDSEFYNNIIMQAGIDPETALQRELILQCCKICCLLLLRNPPVKDVWDVQESLVQDSEHVDKKDWEHQRKPAFL